MPVTGESELVDFDAAAALEAARDAAGREAVRSFVEFTFDEFTILYVDDGVVSMYRDEAHLREHYGRMLAHLNMDFMERDTYETTLLPNAGRVRALVTHMEDLVLLRVLVDTEGLYLALDPSASTRAVTDAIEDALDVTDG